MRMMFWWVWPLVAIGAWVSQRSISWFSDKTVPENELTLFWGTVRMALIIVTLVCLGVSATLFVQWVRIF
jgi:hypothetical protein